MGQSISAGGAVELESWIEEPSQPSLWFVGAAMLSLLWVARYVINHSLVDGAELSVLEDPTPEGLRVYLREVVSLHESQKRLGAKKSTLNEIAKLSHMIRYEIEQMEGNISEMPEIVREIERNILRRAIREQRPHPSELPKRERKLLTELDENPWQQLPPSPAWSNIRILQRFAIHRGIALE